MFYEKLIATSYVRHINVLGISRDIDALQIGVTGEGEA